MEPIYFPEATENLIKPKEMTDDECKSLWVRQTKDGHCISCWKVPFWKRVKLLFHGNVWLGVVSGVTQPPVWIEVEKQIFVDKDD